MTHLEPREIHGDHGDPIETSKTALLVSLVILVTLRQFEDRLIETPGSQHHLRKIWSECLSVTCPNLNLASQLYQCRQGNSRRSVTCLTQKSYPKNHEKISKLRENRLFQIDF